MTDNRRMWFMCDDKTGYDDRPVRGGASAARGPQTGFTLIEVLIAPAIVVRAWIGASGTVTRVEFATLVDPNADAALRQLLTAGPLAEPPPPDMRQPLRVRLRLTPNPDAPVAASGAVAAAP